MNQNFSVAKDIRSHIIGSSAIFADVLVRNPSVDVYELGVNLLDRSRLLREHIRILQDSISETAALADLSNSVDDISNTLEAEHDFVFDMANLWHLCEICSLNSTDNLNYEMIEWLKVFSCFALQLFLWLVF
jgi:hypothetical protein